MPLPEQKVFRGDLQHFPKWLKSFETIIESQTVKVEERLYYLGCYTAGDAKEAIKGYKNQNSADAYKTSKEILFRRYRNPFEVASAYRKKIQDCPKIPNNDGLSLRKYSDFLNQAESAMTSFAFLNVLNDPEENKQMVSKLPGYLFNRWAQEVDQWLTTDDKYEDEYSPFSAFCKFLRKEARIACNPIMKDDKPKGGKQPTAPRKPPSAGAVHTKPKLRKTGSGIKPRKEKEDIDFQMTRQMERHLLQGKPRT